MRDLHHALSWLAVAALLAGAPGCSFIRDFGQFPFGDGGSSSMDGGQVDDDSGTPPGEETCDGEDQDGDGSIDEGVTRTCGTDMGECTAGVETCSDGTFGACEGAVEPADEECDGSADEDCDGAVDEGCACTPGETQDCGSDVGECRFGTQTCQPDATWGSCMGGQMPITEACDGVDNDCDESTDEAPADSACAFGCNVDAGRCNNCPVGGSECTDSDTSRVCPDGSAWMTQVCEHGCNATRNECNVCTPGSVQCADADNEQECLADGSGWGAPTSCEFGCESPSYNRCRTCDPSAGTYQCSSTNPDIRIQCNSSGFTTGGWNCPLVWPGPEPDGCNPSTGHCYHE
jgi:hypothetical protein